jgi:4-hydroxy-tetrahydrodipicolinate synthase
LYRKGEKIMIEGIFPAFPTPFSKDGLTIQYELTAPLVDRMLDEGASGFFICGTTGEGPSLSADEKIQFTEHMVSTVSKRAQILLQISCGDLTSTLKVAKKAKELGVDAVSVLQPWFYHCDSDAQVRYIEIIAESVGDFPLYLYNLPCFAGNDLQPKTLEAILDRCPTVRGMKESGEPQSLLHWFQYQSDRFQVICGNDNAVRKSFENGGKAAVASTANVLTKWFRNLYDSVQLNENDTAELCQGIISEYTNLMNSSNTIAMIKASLRLRGTEAGYVRAPNRDLTEEEFQAFKENLIWKKIV